MAVLHKKEEKIQATLGRLPKKYTHEQFIEMFIKLYSKDWGKIKSAYIKQSQDKEPGSVINMPKPDIYLKQVLAIYLQQADAPKTESTPVPEIEKEVAEVKKAKAPAKKKAVVAEETPAVEAKKVKAPAKKKAEETTEEPVAEVKKAKTPAKKKVAAEAEETTEVKKPKAVAKKPATKK